MYCNSEGRSCLRGASGEVGSGRGFWEVGATTVDIL